MANTNNRTELETLIKSGYPLVYIVSSEESRVLGEVLNIAKTHSLALSTWTFTKGLKMAHGAGLSQNCSKPGEALAYVEQNQKKAGIVVFQDLHGFMDKDPTIVRAVRDVVESFRTGKEQRTLILLSPVQSIPVEIEKSCAVLDWALPTREELHTLITHALKGSGAKAPPSIEAIVDAACGLTETEAENAISKSIHTTGTLDAKVIYAEKKQIIKKSGILEYEATEVHETQVGGMASVKTWLRARRHAYSAKARAFKLDKPKGLLVLGVQGTGKSLLSRMVGHEWNLPLLTLDVGKVYGGLVGASEANMDRVLKTLVAVAPCVVRIDEIEKQFAGSQSSGMTDGGTSSRVLSKLLTWLQENEAPVFVVATANQIRNLPPELLRRGRFDEIFFVDLPTEQEREAIFKIHLAMRDRPATLVTEALIASTDGFSGAEIEQVVKDALYFAFELDRELTTADLMLASERTIPLSRTMGQPIEELRQWARDKARPATLGEAPVNAALN